MKFKNHQRVRARRTPTQPRADLNPIERAISLFPSNQRAAARKAVAKALRELEDDQFMEARMDGRSVLLLVDVPGGGMISLKWGGQ